jgi:hypothetical protein
VNGFIENLELVTTNHCNTINNLHALKKPISHAKSQAAIAFTGRCLVVACNNGVLPCLRRCWLSTVSQPTHDQTNCLSAKCLLVLDSTVIFRSESHETRDHILLSDGSGSFQTTLIVRVRVTLRLAVYRQSVRFRDKPLEDHDQRFLFN